MNWNKDNVITEAMGKELYNTEELIRLFEELDRDGYSGLSLGLIIDLIRDRVGIDYVR
jgi:hypothetical protein